MHTISTIFGIEHRVSRPVYVIVGFSLMLVKYLVEAATVWKVTGMIYPPWVFLIPSFSLREPFFAAFPDWYLLVMVAWSLPFVWIAVTMSIRRAVDAGVSPIVGLLVIAPLVNLLIMLMLACLPSIDAQRGADDVKDVDEFDERLPRLPVAERTPKSETKLIYAAILGVLVGGIFALVSTVLSVTMLHNYGNSLFLGMPVVAGAVAGFVYNQPCRRSISGSMGVGVLSVLIGGAGLLLFAVEGVICLVMAFPLIVPMGALGGLLGWFLSSVILLQYKWMLSGALAFVPLLGWVETHCKTFQVHRVESSVIVDAPPDVVWKYVVSFPEIESPPAWYFRLGVASPLRATIHGHGVGAVRHCEFTTGCFIEPITVWNEPRRLAFDVSEQPDPLVELTPYRNLHPPHLQHSLRSVRGEFELIALADGRTRLIGRTWYTIDMGPRIYWRFWTDGIIHRIHLRVLRHIATTAINGN